MNATIHPSSHPRYEWHNNRNGTYNGYDENHKWVSKPIPSHPKLNEIYQYVFNYADEKTYWSGTFEQCMNEVKERFGEITNELKDYLHQCPYDAGARRALLREEPNHYD